MGTELVQLSSVNSAENLYKVSVRQWRKWDAFSRFVFNEVYSSMIGDPWAFSHPKAAEVPDGHWTTTAWNAAWTAAEAVRNAP